MGIGLRWNGKAIGVDPMDPFTVYANRDYVGSWETVIVTPHDGYVDVRFQAANRQLCITPDGKLETRPAGAIGEWERLAVVGGVVLRRAGVSLTVDGVLPVPVSTIHLEQRGNDFVDAAGKRIVFPAVDAFFAFRLYRDGGPDALRPFFEESNRLGFKAWRMWSQASKAQNGVDSLSPKEAGYYDDVRPCTDLINAHGIVPIWTGFVDNQDVKSPIGHWVELGARLAGAKALMSGFNQWSKNKSDFDPWALPSPGAGIIWSRGSDVDDTITDPRGAPASELHATRISFDRALMDATASPPYMRSKGAGMVWMTEGQPFGDSAGYSEAQARCLGCGYSILWALAVHHNRQSQRGQLMQDATARTAAAFVAGMTKGMQS